MSKDLVCAITSGDLTQKPGWMRLSIHPTTTDEEIAFVCDSIKALSQNHMEWSKDYIYNHKSNDFEHINKSFHVNEMVNTWFK
jgi:hypothetical protein